MNYLFLAQGFEEIEALTTVDVLRRAGMELKTVSVAGGQDVAGAHGVVVKADCLLKDGEDIAPEVDDFLILPGGLPGAVNLRNSEVLCRLLTAHAAKGGYEAAICAAPYVLGELGLLKGRKATCYPGFDDKLDGAEYTGKLVECDGRFVTGKGPAASLEFAFAIVEKVKGKDVVVGLREGMMCEA